MRSARRTLGLWLPDRNVVGVIGTWHSGRAADEIPILDREQSHLSR